MTVESGGTPVASPKDLARAYLEAFQRKGKKAILCRGLG
jgi:hypothetical protein